MSETCADHGVPADGACVSCKRPMCHQCPVNAGRCQACAVDQLLAPRGFRVDPAVGVKVLKLFIALGLLAVALGVGCSGCQRWLSAHIHT